MWFTVLHVCHRSTARNFLARKRGVCRCELASSLSWGAVIADILLQRGAGVIAVCVFSTTNPESTLIQALGRVFEQYGF